MSAFSDEQPINPLTYRFVPKRDKTPPHLRKIKKITSYKPEHYKVIHKLACAEGISYSRALERILDSAEYKGTMTPQPTLREKLQNTLNKYASYNLVKNGKQAKGVPSKTKGQQSK